MESSALASLMPPPAASAAATVGAAAPQTAAGAAFAAVLSATELTVGASDLLALTGAQGATPAAAPDGQGGNDLPQPAAGGRSPLPTGADAGPASAPAAVTAGLLETLAGAAGTAPLPGVTPDPQAARPARRPVVSDDGEAHADGLALSPLAVAIRAADLRPTPKGGPATLPSTGAADLGDAAPLPSPGAAATGVAEDGSGGSVLVAVPPESGPMARRFALPGAEASLRAGGPVDPGVTALLPPSSPPVAAPVAFAAAVAGAQGARSEVEGAPAAPVAARNDAQGASAAWAAVDDTRLAAFARHGADARSADPLDIDAPVGSRAWERALGERVVWLVGQQLQAAEIRLTPPHLGPVEVRLTLSGSEASLSFGTPHAPVRDAIEQALPRLREQLAEQNLVLVNVDVGDRGLFGQAQGRQEVRHFAMAPAVAPDVTDPPREHPGGRRGPASGLLDEYA